MFQIPNLISLLSNNNGKKYINVQLKRKTFQIKTPVIQSLSSSWLSAADLAQPVVCLGVGYDGLNCYNGLVDLGLELPQLLDVQQAQDLSRFVQSGIWKLIPNIKLSIFSYFALPVVLTLKKTALTSSVETQAVLV